MRWARRHIDPDLTWPAGGPRWHLIADTSTGALTGACHRAVPPPFEVVPETPAAMRCSRCDIHVPAAAIDAEMTVSPRGTLDALRARMGDKSRELLSLRAIVVSGRNALSKAPDAEDRQRIMGRLPELLGQLEEAFIRDGADAEALARLEEARQEAWE